MGGVGGETSVGGEGERDVIVRVWEKSVQTDLNRGKSPTVGGSARKSRGGADLWASGKKVKESSH